MDDNSYDEIEQSEGHSEEEVAFLPFHAINEFMRSDYRLEVIRTTLQALGSLPEEHRAPINQMTRRYVSVPGFRNSAKAPVPVRARGMVEPFENNPELVAHILSAWSASRPELRQAVYEFLAHKGFELLPPEADRKQLPGFLTTWPEEHNLEALTEAFEESHPEFQASSDDITLMMVWLAGRLPYPQAE